MNSVMRTQPSTGTGTSPLLVQPAQTSNRVLGEPAQIFTHWWGVSIMTAPMSSFAVWRMATFVWALERRTCSQHPHSQPRPHPWLQSAPKPRTSKSFLSIGVSKPLFQAGIPKIIFHFPRNPCLWKRKQNKEAIGRVQRLCKYCQLPAKISLDIRGIPAILSRNLLIRRFLVESLAVCCGTLWSTVCCVIKHGSG